MKWVPIGRIAALPKLWGGRGRYTWLAGKNWAIIVMRRDDRIPPDGGAREAGE